MILLSKVSAGMFLSSKFLYFNKPISSDTRVCDEFVLGIMNVQGTNKNISLRVRIIENQARMLEISYSTSQIEPEWIPICSSNFGWQGIYKYVRTIELPTLLGIIPYASPNDVALYSWIPYVDFISVINSPLDRPMLHYSDINPNEPADLVYDKVLYDVKAGDDLTDKVIIFDTSVSFEDVASDSLTIGDPLPDSTDNSTWFIKYSLCSTAPNAHNEITAGVRKDNPTILLNDNLWIKNYVDLTAKETYERFIVNQLPSAPKDYLQAVFVCSKIPKSSASTTLEILREAAKRMHIPEPASVETIPTDLSTSDAQNSMLLLTSLNQSLKSIAIFSNWPQMLREVRFNAIRDQEHFYNDIIRGFDLEKICPSYDGIVSPFIYDLARRYAIPQVFEKEYYDMTLGNTIDAPLDQMAYRVVANHICFSSDVNGMVTFLYKTKYSVKSVSGEWKETAEADKDVCIFDPELCVLGTIVSFKASIGQDPSIETALFDRYMDHLKSINGMPSTTPINYQGS
jgi:hypothetical protein